MKLKIRAVNESNTQKTLTEADVDRGYRIKAIEKLSAKVGEAVTAAHYKYKPVSQTGFYIMPDFGYLGKLKLTGTDEEEPTFTVQINDVHAKDLPVNGKIIKKLTYDELLDVADDIGLALAKTLIAPANFEAVSENLTEDLLLEYGPWSSIKGFFNQVATNVTDFFAKKAANKAEKKGTKAILQGINETLTEALNDSIKALLKDGKQYVTVKSTIDGNSLTLELKSDFVTALTFNADPRDARKIIVSKLLTPLGEVKVKGKSINDALAMVGKVLDIDFKLDPETVVIPSEPSDLSAEDEPESSDYWASLIGVDAFSELGVVAEALEDMITETYKMKIPATNYKKAFDKVISDDAGKALVRYFLLNETGGVLSEDDVKKLDVKTIDDITDIIKDSNTFNPNAAFSLLYILNYIRKYKTVDNVAISFAKELPRFCQTANILENLSSIVYNKILFNSATDVTTLTALLKYWYTSDTFKKNSLVKLSKNSRKNLCAKFEIPNAFAELPETETLAMKKYLLLDPATSGDGKKFRTLSEIQAIEKAVKDVYAAARGKGSTASEEDTPVEATSDSVIDAAVDNIDSLDAAALKNLLMAASKEGSGSSELRSKLARAVLVALGKIEA